MPASPPYTPYYANWQDGSGGGTPIDAAALNHMEAGIEVSLPAPTGPVSGDLPIWNPAANGGAGGWDTTTNIKIAKAALASLDIKDADIDVAAAISLSKLNGFPNSATKFLRGDGVWSAASQAPYRKTTGKNVVNTVTETDLLNGEITIAGNLLGSSGLLRLTILGNILNNSGSAQVLPRFKLKFGAVTLLDTGTAGGGTLWAASATEGSMEITARIMNAGVTNSQLASLDIGLVDSFSAGNGFFTSGQGQYAAQTNDIAFARGTESGAAVDTTVSQVLALTVILPAANASLSVNLTGALIEVL